MKVAITSESDVTPVVTEVFENAGVEVVRRACRTAEEVIETARDADGILVAIRPSDRPPDTGSAAKGEGHLPQRGWGRFGGPRGGNGVGHLRVQLAGGQHVGGCRSRHGVAPVDNEADSPAQRKGQGGRMERPAG